MFIKFGRASWTEGRLANYKSTSKTFYIASSCLFTWTRVLVTWSPVLSRPSAFHTTEGRWRIGARSWAALRSTTTCFSTSAPKSPVSPITIHCYIQWEKEEVIIRVDSMDRIGQYLKKYWWPFVFSSFKLLNPNLILQPRTSYESSTKERSFEWLHFTILSTDSKARTIFYNIMNRSTEKCCSIAFIWLV